MRTVLILNPASGLSPLAEVQGTVESNEEMILAALNAYSIEPEVWYTTLEDPGGGLASKAADEHVDLVIAAGGDGTIHAVASGLIGRESTLGIIPLGTMNNVAHSLSIPFTVEAACATLVEGKTRAIDVGRINEKIFLELAGVGLEAALFPYVEEMKSFGVLAALHGVIKGLFTLFAYQTTKLKISFDEKKFRSYHAIQVTICNTPFYGPHFQIVPDVLMDDGLLDVIIFRNYSKLEYVRHAISIWQGKRELRPKFAHRRVKSLHLKTDHPVEIQADGLPHGHTPATITIVPGALKVRVSAGDVAGLETDSAGLVNLY
jgi:diacylglycerol kinase (ATP)